MTRFTRPKVIPNAGFDYTKWIAIAIEANHPWVDEAWIRASYENSVRLPGHDPLRELLALHERRKAAEVSEVARFVASLTAIGYRVTPPDGASP